MPNYTSNNPKPSQQMLAQVLADIIGARYGLEIKVHVEEKSKIGSQEQKEASA